MTAIMVLIRSRRKTWSEHFLRNLPNMSFHDSAASTASTLPGTLPFELTVLASFLTQNIFLPPVDDTFIQLESEVRNTIGIPHSHHGDILLEPLIGPASAPPPHYNEHARHLRVEEGGESCPSLRASSFGSYHQHLDPRFSATPSSFTVE